MALSAGDSLNNPPQGSPELTAQQGKVGLACAANLARLAGAAARRPTGSTRASRPRPWRESAPPMSAIIARSPRRGCRISCSNISTAVRTTR